MVMNKISCFEGAYDKALFYSKMGRFFAEEKYIQQMPYLRNETDRVWFTIEENNQIIAFSSLLSRQASGKTHIQTLSRCGKSIRNPWTAHHLPSFLLHRIC